MQRFALWRCFGRYPSKLCDVNSITYPDKTKIDALNVELQKRYIRQAHSKEITARLTCEIMLIMESR